MSPSTRCGETEQASEIASAVVGTATFGLESFEEGGGLAIVIDGGAVCDFASRLSGDTEHQSALRKTSYSRFSLT